MNKIFKTIKENLTLLGIGIISLLSFFLLQYKRKSDILEREAVIKDKTTDIKVAEEKLKHEEETKDLDVNDYKSAKSKYDKLRSDG